MADWNRKEMRKCLGLPPDVPAMGSAGWAKAMAEAMQHPGFKVNLNPGAVDAKGYLPDEPTCRLGSQWPRKPAKRGRRVHPTAAAMFFTSPANQEAV